MKIRKSNPCTCTAQSEAKGCASMVRRGSGDSVPCTLLYTLLVSEKLTTRNQLCCHDERAMTLMFLCHMVRLGGQGHEERVRTALVKEASLGQTPRMRTVMYPAWHVGVLPRKHWTVRRWKR